MSSYYDDKKKKLVIMADGSKKEFDPEPSLMGRLKEGFEPTNTRVQLEAIRKRRQGNS